MLTAGFDLLTMPDASNMESMTEFSWTLQMPDRGGSELRS